MKIQTTNTSFNGILHGCKGYALSKPVYTCKHGDRLLISTFLDAVNNGKSFQIKKEPGFNKIVLESDLDINFNLFERMKFLISNEQIEMLNKKKNGEYDTLVYILSDDEFSQLKTKKSMQPKLNEFSNLLKKHSPENLKEFIEKFFT